MLAVWATRTRGALPVILRGVSLAPAILPNVLIALGFFIVCVFAGITDNELVLIAAHATLGLPFVVLITAAALADTDPTLERAARVLGAGPLRAFATGTLPSILPAIASAALFAFFISFDELIVALFTMGGKLTLPVRMWTELQFEIDPTISAVSILLILLTTAGMGLAEMLRRRVGRRHGGSE
jgi:putative spermidine/putrescine transport system permease protein